MVVDAPIPARRHRRWTRGGDARCEDADVLAAEADATLAQRPTVGHDVAMLCRVTTTSERRSPAGLAADDWSSYGVTLGYARAHIRESLPHVPAVLFKHDSARTAALFHKRVCFVLL